MVRNNIIAPIFFGVILFVAFMIGGAIGNSIVYNFCNAARTDNSVSEETCGRLQDTFNIKFECMELNHLKSNFCWTE